jgi:flavin reductase (DIM6/NTAB) family NADH-FMN oxidoreductase RutF
METDFMRRLDLDSGEISWRDAYALCISFINPRPIALVSSLSSDGKPNLAPFSFYNMVCANPPTVMFCPGLRRDGTKKDSLVNVEATREFVVATVTEPIAEAMNLCATDLPAGESEFDLSGLTPASATHVRPLLVAESPVNLECTLDRIVPLGDGPGSTSVVFGRIVAIHIADWIRDEQGNVDPRRLRAVGRLGGSQYTTVRESYMVPRPTR